jgi:Spy/CpxP family protein refolding chaperone
MTRRLNPYLAALLAAGSLALAVPSVQAHPGDGPRAEMRGGGMRMLRGLDLTQEQRDQVFKIFHEQAPAVRERMQAARDAQQALRKSALSGSFDAAQARQLAEAAGKAHAELALMRAETMSKVAALLTPEQRARLEERRERRGRR